MCLGLGTFLGGLQSSFSNYSNFDPRRWEFIFFEVEPHILHRYEEAQKHNVPNEQEVIFFCCFIYIVLLYFINSYCCYIIKIK